MTCLPSPSVPVSWGELLDKLTILEIKQERIACPAARANVARELTMLRAAGAEAMAAPGVAPLVAALKQVNEALWSIEDAIREEDARARFGADFVRLAQSVYRQNDRRAAIKREINRALKSELVEEKSYWSAGPQIAGPTAPAAAPALSAATAAL